MTRRKGITHSLLFLLFVMGIALQAQISQAKTYYPIVHKDHSVTFRVWAPKAKKVFLEGNFIPKAKQNTSASFLSKIDKIEMKEEDGWWVHVTEPLESEMYTYNFIINGKKKITDPLNPNKLRDIDNQLSYFFVPGGIADDYVEKKVPHGEIIKVWYPSKLNKMTKRRMSIYLPPDYKKSRTRTYPVLYLLHGSGGDEDSWQDSGRAAQILDNLMASGRCKPMIVVMPNGNVTLAAAPGEDPANPKVKPTGNNMESMFGGIEKVFMDEVVRYVEKEYRVQIGKKYRAIAGLSLGGLHTLYISLNNPNAFDYVGLFSAQTSNAMTDKRIRNFRNLGEVIDNIKEIFPFIKKKENDSDLSIYENLNEKLKVQFSNPPHLYYIALGTSDFVKKLNDDFRSKLNARGYKYVYHETDGGHTWNNWRKYLVDFLPRLFK